jgi:hypothetical protein
VKAACLVGEIDLISIGPGQEVIVRIVLSDGMLDGEMVCRKPGALLRPGSPVVDPALVRSYPAPVSEIVQTCQVVVACRQAPKIDLLPGPSPFDERTVEADEAAFEKVHGLPRSVQLL